MCVYVYMHIKIYMKYKKCVCVSDLFGKRISLPSLRCLIRLGALLPALPLSLFRMFFDVEFKAAANVFFIWHTFRRASLPTPSMQSALKENSNDFGLVGL